ncbi:hypothetical protein BDM02DRAFT_3183801 [Thelephora ganbajun]|uniref:Uncharacterized protein n=1 Tax=Thelephora ganbajun TaxID=370292 RepID=A0ACB6ZSY8_THEGA|nr:hypothetical protein BDM02DRAFT_3183801 [Thelephora ganbajun]
MVAQPQSTTTKPAPLSYADRARNHTKNESLPTKPAVNGVSANNLSPVNTPGPSKPTTAIKVFSSNPKRSPSLPAPSMRHPSTSNSSTRSAETNSTLSVNGHPLTINGHPPPTSETTTPPHPPVNFWNLRKEQMAQSQATQKSSVIPSAKDPPPSVASQDRDPNTSSGLRDSAVSSRPIPSANGVPTLASENDDPFTIKPRNLQPVNPIPPVEDKESWPEVGSSVTSSTSNNGKERVEGPAKPPQDSSKKEKRRWVPVPPEEPQATADALQPRHHGPHPRNRSQYRNNDNSANASSGSGEISQRSSRPHSVRTSASHSRVSSRTGSVHTSPRFNPANRSLYDTPEVPSPVSYPEALHNSRYLHPNPPIDNSMNNPYAYSYSPIEGSSTGSSSQHYYSGSAGYENHPLPHPPPRISGPPHFHHVSHYQPQLGSGHGYPQLSQPTPHRPSDSTINFTPLPPTQDSDGSRIPLPTMLTRPPPPEHSAPVDGYRDVGAALSTNSPNQTFVFGRIRPQATEEDSNTSVPSPELVVKVTDESTGTTPPRPRLLPFTVGVTQESPTVTVKGRKSRIATATGDFASGGVTDKTKPEMTFQFGSFPSLDVAPGSTSELTGALDQVASVELESLRSDTGDEWQVRDFGYGFGHMSGLGNAAAVVREELNVREQQRVQERRHREDQEREGSESSQDRPRRGSLNSGYERGGYSGRRGRGLNGGYGRGYGRNFPRGGYGQYPRQQHQYSATPPGQFSQLPPHATHGYSPDQSVYFLPPPPPPPPGFGPYHPAGYDVYQYPSFPPPPLYPPVPQPTSQLSFLLDPTRYYLLGQLEYYLSPQNMAQDFYLRQQMNPDGWISISLLASFNRIRQLTPDPQLVREVLTMSSVAEVGGDWVRMGGNQWIQFILPPPTPSAHQPTPETTTAQESVEEDGNADEEDDDDVEFVISQEHENSSWTSERHLS